MMPFRVAAPAAALLAALGVLGCGKEAEPTPTPDPEQPGGTVDNVPDNQAQHFVATDPSDSASWTFALQDQVAIPSGVREVFVELHACRHAYEPPGVMRFRTPESTSWRNLNVDQPLCGKPGTPAAQVWLPVSESPKLVVEAVRPETGGQSYVLTTVKVLGWVVSR
ncbi:hypothetical protein JGU66_34975 [Myxococcaceae bacterium JPH2]|nr:hypothetical protein [Myxococcaceae bacterium JPH2]